MNQQERLNNIYDALSNIRRYRAKKNHHIILPVDDVVYIVNQPDQRFKSYTHIPLVDTDTKQYGEQYITGDLLRVLHSNDDETLFEIEHDATNDTYKHLEIRTIYDRDTNIIERYSITLYIRTDESGYRIRKLDNLGF